MRKEIEFPNTTIFEKVDRSLTRQACVYLNKCLKRYIKSYKDSTINSKKFLKLMYTLKVECDVYSFGGHADYSEKFEQLSSKIDKAVLLIK